MSDHEHDCICATCHHERYQSEIDQLRGLFEDASKENGRLFSVIHARDARIATLEAALLVERNDIWHDPWCVFLEGDPPRKQTCNCTAAERIGRIDQALAAQDGRGGKEGDGG